jgi:hypothetical protein
MAMTQSIQTVRMISLVCGALSGALGLFWVIEVVRAQVPADVAAGAALFCFPLISMSFLLFLCGRRIPVVSWWPFLPFIARLAMDQKHRFRAAGVASLAGAIGFIIVMTVLQRQRRRAAQPGVEPDGPAARGLTP